VHEIESHNYLSSNEEMNFKLLVNDNMDICIRLFPRCLHAHAQKHKVEVEPEKEKDNEFEGETQLIYIQKGEVNLSDEFRKHLNLGGSLLAKTGSMRMSLINMKTIKNIFK
jgi:hypothetical protein